MEKSNIKQDLIKIKNEIDQEQMNDDELQNIKPKMNVNIYNS
jgi:hypothetical protein